MAGGLIASIASEAGSTRTVEPGEVLTFGRSEECDLRLDVRDSSISRVAGEVSADATTWAVVNRSSTRPLYRIDDTGLRTAIPVGARVALVDPLTNIAIVGSIRTHVVTLELATPRGDRPVAPPARGAETTRPIFTPNEFSAVVALLEGYLHEMPRYEPRPRTYAEAAERLGVPAATVRKRIENVREKLVASGVAELRQPDARLALAEFLLSTRIVQPSDLAVLDAGGDAVTIHDSGLRIEGFDELTPIGRGGSSDVYRGVDDQLGRTVAVKVLRFDGRSADPTRLFLRECQATERLSNHPHIATVFRSGVTADGRPYVVVEDATNGSLGDELVDGPLSLERVAEVGRAIAAALAYAHAHGVQHRDVKPSNVLVAADGTPLLADFGLAAVAGSTATTVSGHPYTLAYAPPEVLRGRPTDERSDVYSLGATLYELIEGRPPFAELGLTMPEVLARTLNSNVPPITRDDVPRSVRELVMSMLSADPSARPDLEAVIAVLDDPHADRPSRTGRRHRPRPGLVVGGAVLVVAVVCAGVWWSVRDDATATSPPARLAATPRAPQDSTPYRAGTDESAELAASLSGTDAATAAIVDRPATPLPIAVYLRAPTFPAIPSLPDSTRWRFSHLSDAERSCWEYFPSEMTMTGFAATARLGGSESVIVAHYALENANEAAQFFRGRSISLGVTAATCHVDGDDVHIDQRTAPLSARPAWADQVSSWTVTPDQRGPGEQEAVVYVFRVGRTLWEARIGTGSGTSLTNTELRHLLDAIGTAAAG